MRIPFISLEFVILSSRVWIRKSVISDNRKGWVNSHPTLSRSPNSANSTSNGRVASRCVASRCFQLEANVRRVARVTGIQKRTRICRSAMRTHEGSVVSDYTLYTRFLSQRNPHIYPIYSQVSRISATYKRVRVLRVSCIKYGTCR